MVGDQHLDQLNTSAAISFVQDSLLATLPTALKWADGSGLSRYNKTSPQNAVHLLHQLWKDHEQAYLWSFFPAGGERGTIRRWYANPDGGRPYVYAKTGTLTGVHCLSGYILTDSRKTLIFSFMHNNFPTSSRIYKEEMKRILEYLKANY